MSEEITLWRSGHSVVTTERVSTRRITVSLLDVDLVEIRRPLLGGAGAFALATTALGLRFGDVLLSGEFFALIGAGWTGVAVGLLLARVKLHSYSLDSVAITLPIWQAGAMRQAIDAAIAGRPRRKQPRRKTR